MNCGCTDTTGINQVKAVRQNITVFKGDTFKPIIFKLWSDIAKTIPIDVTPNTYVMRVYLGSKTWLLFDLVKSSPNIITATTDALNTLNTTTYSWDIKQTTPDGDITTYRYGDFRIKQ